MSIFHLQQLSPNPIPSTKFLAPKRGKKESTEKTHCLMSIFHVSKLSPNTIPNPKKEKEKVIEKHTVQCLFPIFHSYPQDNPRLCTRGTASQTSRTSADHLLARDSRECPQLYIPSASSCHASQTDLQAAVLSQWKTTANGKITLLLLSGEISIFRE